MISAMQPCKRTINSSIMNVVPMFPLMFSGKVALEKQGDAAAQPAAKAMEPCDAAIEKITEEKPIQSGSGK